MCHADSVCTGNAIYCVLIYDISYQSCSYEGEKGSSGATQGSPEIFPVKVRAQHKVISVLLVNDFPCLGMRFAFVFASSFLGVIPKTQRGRFARTE
jgi:hypothetical protein